MNKKSITIGLLLGVSLITPFSSTSANELGNTPFTEFTKSLLYRLSAGEESRQLVYTADKPTTHKSQSVKPKSYGYAVCHHPDPIGCNINRSKSFLSSDYTLLTWKKFVKRRVGISNPKIIGIIFDPINQKVIVYYTYTK